MERLRGFFGGQENKKGPIFLSEDDEETASSSQPDGHDALRSGEEEAQQRRQSEDQATIEANGLPKTQRNSAIVRHGRGLLSEDGDDDNDAAAAHWRASSRRRSRDQAGDDDDVEDSDSVDELLGAWNTRQEKKRRRFTWKTISCYIFLFLLGVAFIAFAIIHIWVGRFVAETMRDDGALLKERAPDALIWRGPDKIKILHMDSNTTTVQVDMRMGFDVRIVFGWNETAQSNDQQKHKLSWTRKTERRIIGWMTRRVGQASMDITRPILLSDLEQTTSGKIMAATGFAKPITIPLRFTKSESYDHEDESWLRPMSLIIPFEVLDPDTMATFVNKTISEKNGRIRVKIQEAQVSLGREDDRRWLSRIVSHYGGQRLENIEVEQAFEVSDSPEMPDPDEMVKLKSYSLIAIPNNSTHHNGSYPTNETLAIHASARVLNPGYEQMHKYALDLDIPFQWPFKVFLSTPANKSDLVLLARGALQPFTIPSNSKHFDVYINGTVEQTVNSSTPLSDALSTFVSRYLAGKNNTAHVAFDPDSPLAQSIPSFLPSLLAPMIVSNVIPGLPADQRDLLKDLKIDKMRIHGSETGGGGWECDGEMQGELAMPEALDQLQGGINITEIWPDILLYDGMPPIGNDKHNPPVPLPRNAFARFKTRDWQPAVTYIDPVTNATIMRSMTKNVPLDILKTDVLQKWIAKIIFSGGKGALTGIKGVTQARSSIRGFGQIELHSLPILGTFYANKPNMASLPSLGFFEQEE